MMVQQQVLYLEAFPFKFVHGEGEGIVQLELTAHETHFHVHAQEGELKATSGFKTLGDALAFLLYGAYLMVSKNHPGGWKLVHFISKYHSQWGAAARFGEKQATCAGTGSIN